MATDERRFSFLGKICQLLCINLTKTFSGGVWGDRYNGLANWAGNTNHSRPNAKTRDLIFRESDTDEEWFIFRIFHKDVRTLKKPLHVVLNWTSNNGSYFSPKNKAAIQVFVLKDGSLETDFQEDAENDTTLAIELNLKNFDSKEMLYFGEITIRDVVNDSTNDPSGYSKERLHHYKSIICDAIFKHVDDPNNSIARVIEKSWFGSKNSNPATLLSSNSTACLLQRLEALGLPE